MQPLPAGKEASPGGGVHQYERHRPEKTFLYRLVDQHYPGFAEQLAAQGRPLPEYVQREFKDYLKCGRLEHGFLRVRCTDCHRERLVAFSCKRRGFCPSCGARRMTESAALLVDDILPEAPIRQWVLSFPYALRFLFATRPAVMGKVLGIVYRTLATHQVRKAGYTHRTARTGAVTLIQRFGSALNLNIHFHMLLLDGVYVSSRDPREHPRFQRVQAPNSPLRGEVTPGRRGRRVGVQSSAEPKTEVKHRLAMSWAQRLRRVFNIDVETCEACGGRGVCGLLSG